MDDDDITVVDDDDENGMLIPLFQNPLALEFLFSEFKLSLSLSSLSSWRDGGMIPPVRAASNRFCISRCMSFSMLSRRPKKSSALLLLLLLLLLLSALGGKKNGNGNGNDDDDDDDECCCCC